MKKLLILGCLWMLGCPKDPICSELVERAGQKYCAAPPTQAWDPGTVVLAAAGRDGHFNARRLCERKDFGVPSYTCGPTDTVTEDVLAKASARISADALKAVGASAQFKSVKNLKVTLEHAQICEIAENKLRNGCFKHACGEAASSVEEEGTIVWISQALKADIALDLTTEEAIGVVATADVAKLVSMVGGGSPNDGGVEALLKVQVDQEDNKHIKVRGNDLFWGFSGRIMSKEIRSGLSDQDCSCGGEGRVCCDQAVCVAGLQCSSGLCAKPPPPPPVVAAPCRFNTPGSLVDNGSGKIVYRAETGTDPNQVVFVLEQAPPLTWWKAIALRSGQNEQKIEVRDGSRGAELPYSPHEPYELRFGKAGALGFWAGVIEVPMDSTQCIGKRVIFRWERD